MNPLREPIRRTQNSLGARRPGESEFPDRAFAQQEAALQRVGAQLRAANETIEGIKQRLQAQISPKKR